MMQAVRESILWAVLFLSFVILAAIVIPALGVVIG